MCPRAIRVPAQSGGEPSFQADADGAPEEGR